MDSNYKTEEEEVDRISNLPNSLIHHILSFLDIIRVAQTSVLSKKWRDIWITVPILDFRKPLCYEPTSLETNNFMDFVDGTLHRRYSGVNIQKLSIAWHEHLDEHRVSSWITSAARHGVQHLHLYLVQNEPLIFTRCESLVSLRLQANVRFPNYISFPNLKCLEMEGIEFTNKYWSKNENLFSRCPVLEDLKMEHCSWFGMTNFYVSCPALKHVEIDNWDESWLPRGEDDGLRGCTLKVHAPNLETFYYNASVAKEYLLTTFPLLVKASVKFRFKPYFATMDQKFKLFTAISQLLRALANVQCLRVSDDTLQALSFAEDLLGKLPTLYNTKQIIMLDEVTAHKALVALLKATPNLKSLVFRKLLPDDEEDDVSSSDADASEGEDSHGSEDDVSSSNTDASEGEDSHGSEDDVASSNAIVAEAKDWSLNVATDAECLFLHLRSVQFDEFIGNPMEMRWVKLLLKNAKALRTVSISNFYHAYLINKKRREELMCEIQSLPRASTSCVVEFPSW